MVSLLTLNTQINGISKALLSCPSNERSVLVEEAKAVYEKIQMKFGGGDVWTDCAMLNVYCRGLFLNRAKEVFAKLGDKPPLEACTMMLRMWAKLKRPEELQSLWEFCKKQDHFELDETAYMWAIDGFARVNWVKNAVDLVKEMVEEKGMIPNARKHLQLLRRRCMEHDLRKLANELETVVQKTEEIKLKQLKMTRNKEAMMQEKLKGEKVKPFLLPNPVFVATEMKKELKEEQEQEVLLSKVKDKV